MRKLLLEIYLLILKNLKRKSDLDEESTAKRTGGTIGTSKRTKYESSYSNDVKELVLFFFLH